MSDDYGCNNDNFNRDHYTEFSVDQTVCKCFCVLPHLIFITTVLGKPSLPYPHPHPTKNDAESKEQLVSGQTQI